MSTNDKKGRALVTGASAGIGATYAQRLAAQGHDLLLVARDAARLEALAKRLHAEHGVDVAVLPADLTRREDLARVEARLAEDASIGMLVNNAGVAVMGGLAVTDPDQLERIVTLNILATMRLASAAARAFAARRQGTIVNLASILALAPDPNNGVYSGSKAFLLNLTLSMQQELAPLGVRVQAVLPGATRTEIWERSGVDVPEDILMEVGHMVDAALAGLAQGEVVTIPALPDMEGFDAFTRARESLAPYLSGRVPAARYGVRVD
ncbi:SDR family NAD(P)-dependent oxidoreductase [Pseudomonas citronellolis]|uniref:SDR family NAD(P)-dependent oxidoreductase n=1 Tax=Pseudomonas citronellolis TaxID=53408 RepID=UPI0023E402CA|nr:SDR family oxidoreductase [Pseudomonas citronellolis]MDF3932074.1 SDR family oxidoreductase [Pseudomonas citronellolis]